MISIFFRNTEEGSFGCLSGKANTRKAAVISVFFTFSEAQKKALSAGFLENQTQKKALSAAFLEKQSISVRNDTDKSVKTYA